MLAYATRRMPPLVLSLVSVLVAAPAARAASPSTLYACVRRDGTARLYTKKPKCKKHESRLSWNVQGPPGAGGSNGANGAEGRPGANGAVHGFSAENNSGLTLQEGSQLVPEMTIKLPPGSFIASAVIGVVASAETAGAEGVICTLDDEPEGAPARFNYGDWYAALPAPHFKADSHVAIQLAFTATRPSLLTVHCGSFNAEGLNPKVAVFGGFTTMTAIQTAGNG